MERDPRSLCGERQNNVGGQPIRVTGAIAARLSYPSFLIARVFALFNLPALHSMVDRRSDAEDGSRAKRQKMDADPKNNPYLAHMYEESNGSDKHTALAKFKRHQTTAAMAKKAEDGDVNPFSGRPFSSKYFSIMKGRRDLPVHQQRFVVPRGPSQKIAC